MKRARDDDNMGDNAQPNSSSSSSSSSLGAPAIRELTPEEEKEAERLAEIAARAESKAAQRLLEKQLEQNDKQKLKSDEDKESKSAAVTNPSSSNNSLENKLFLTKAERQQLALDRLQQKRSEEEKRNKEAAVAHERFITGKAEEERRREARKKREQEEKLREQRQREESKKSEEFDHEVKAIRDHYLGVKEAKRKIIRPTEKFAKLFQFDWEPDDDTARNDMNPLYNNRMKINPMFGRGYIGGVDLREQRKDSSFLTSLSQKRMSEAKKVEEADESLTATEKRLRARAREAAAEALRKRQEEEIHALDSITAGMGKSGSHWSEKSLEDMTDRDWRIFKEDFDIRIQGGRATLPLRFWREAKFPMQVMKAIEDAGYKDPSPIQRQAIPIGLQKRDIIGIAETGSGKTACFVIPMICYLLDLPPASFLRCADHGPLAIIMAPTRELAQQIQDECIKLIRYTDYKTVCVVGGQSIEEQGYILRKGVEIIIGTPGRMVDCIENSILVLNQCNYVVLDEADRMIDMGFEPQVNAVLESMGGLLKSEDESQAEEQIKNALEGQLQVRITAMFSATMPSGVERIARSFLRHPVVIKIGDDDSGKNKRIEQRVFFISEGQKKNKLLEDLRRLSSSDKAIVFINSKKQGDSIGKYLEQSHFTVGVLHGGRSQDQREETLEYFRSGDIQVLVATDVAGRGLDIKDVTQVINYDMPNKIENYCHRIGRTGRAGRSGVATTYLTEADTEVMFDLKTYLESTDSVIPAQLARHESAQAAAGTRDEKGKLVGQKKDAIMYSKK